MRALRLIALVALVVWIGGLIALGAIVAPATFAVVEAQRVESGRILAGLIFGAIFERFHLVAYGAGALLFASLAARRLLGPRPVHFGVRMATLIALLAVTLYSGLVLTPDIERTRIAIGVPASTLPDGDARRVQFERLHWLSTTLAIVTIIGGLVLTGYEAFET